MATCLTPYTMKNPTTGLYIDVPCGKCYDCLNRRISGWSFRLTKEGRAVTSSYFVTLTYNNENVPITPRNYMTLQKRSIQLYLKRLRKYETKKRNHKKIIYYACGEYGSNGQRPHYHLIIFNASLRGIESAWSNPLGLLGNIYIGTVTGASIGYTLKYMCKDPETRIPKHKNDDREPIFQLQSQGIGKAYLGEFEKIPTTKTLITIQKTGTQYIRQNYKQVLRKKSDSFKWHHASFFDRMFIPIEDGKKIAMPRYYKHKIYTDHERQLIGAKIALLPPRLDEEQRIQQVEANKVKLKNSRLTQKL